MSIPLPNPYAPVELQALVTTNGNETNRCAVVIEQQQVGVVSNDYKLVTNRTVIEAAEDIIRETGLQFTEHNQLWNGKQFRQRYILPDLTEEVRVGDPVSIALDIRNSYDGSMSVAIEFNLLRLVCENGLMVSSMLGGITLRHIGDKDFQQEIGQACNRIKNIGQRLHTILPIFGEMTRKKIKRADIQQFFRDSDLGMTTQSRVFDAIAEDNQWGLYNATTEVLTSKGSFHAESQNRKITDYFLMGDR